jgi:hypothetical protein
MQSLLVLYLKNIHQHRLICKVAVVAAAAIVVVSPLVLFCVPSIIVIIAIAGKKVTQVFTNAYM